MRSSGVEPGQPWCGKVVDDGLVLGGWGSGIKAEQVLGAGWGRRRVLRRRGGGGVGWGPSGFGGSLEYGTFMPPCCKGRVMRSAG